MATRDAERSVDAEPSSRIAPAILGGLAGGLAGACVVVLFTTVLKAAMDYVSRQRATVILVVPLIGLALAVLVLQRLGRSDRAPNGRLHKWRTFRRDAIRADITGDVVDSAGREERFPWRLAPIRSLAIFATVGSGAAMGTEAPAAYLGVATGTWLGHLGPRWRKLLRSAALAGGAAGVSALMGIALVGTAFMLELGRRRNAPISLERVIAALLGGVIGWAINFSFGLNLIYLVIPKEPPTDLLQAAKAAIFIGAISGGVTALAGAAINVAKKWRATPGVRLVFGGLAVVATAWTLIHVAGPSAAIGPGGGAIGWAETVDPVPVTLLVVALLRVLITTAAVATGGCGGVFVPFLAIGDISGRVFAPALGIGSDLAGAAGAAGGIGGGYRLPFTAIAMALGVGGPRLATLTCLATVATAAFVGTTAGKLFERFARLPYLWKRTRGLHPR